MGLSLNGLANLMGNCTPPARSFAFDFASTFGGIDRQKTAMSGHSNARLQTTPTLNHVLSYL
jgi:hypothetical protein